MMRTGETSGNLDAMLGKTADFFEDEAKTKSHQTAIAFGVLVFLLVALLVGRAIIGQYMSYGAGIGNAASGE
jgi:type II secretory pathway component PulF